MSVGASSSLIQSTLTCPIHGVFRQHAFKQGILCAQCSKLLLYQYQPLPRVDCIRLLLLSAGEYSSPVSCRLLSVPLDEAPPYQAISYVWGDPSDTVEIECGNRRLNVRRNLRDALRRLRWPTESRWLWADAVCIDQENVEERSQQVQIMGMIYWMATRVVVWLGEDNIKVEEEKDVDRGTGDAFSMILEIGQTVEKEMEFYGSWDELPHVTFEDIAQYDAKKMASLATLLSLPWFQRTWVIQEIGLAGSAWFVYGNSELSLVDYIPFMKWLTTKAQLFCDHLGISAIPHVLVGDYLQSTRGEDRMDRTGRLSFIDVLSFGRELQCSDSRDHIYAFLGHPSAFQTSPDDLSPFKEYPANFNRVPIIYPDYSKTVEEVCLELATNLLEQSPNIDLLSYVFHDENSVESNFPSWVPRWDIPNSPAAIGLSEIFYYSASGDSQATNLSVVGNSLHIRAIFVDNIEWAVSVDNGFSSTLIGSKDEITGNPLEDLWYQYSYHMITRHPPSIPDLRAFSYTLTAGLIDGTPAKEEPHQHYSNFCAYRLQKSAVSGPKLGESLLETLRSGAVGGNPSQFTVDFQLRSLPRSFLCTDRGFIGIGPKVARKGDQCWVLSGAKVPFILRPRASNSHYKILGEAYIHGIMRGEAMIGEEKDIVLC